MNKNAGSKTRFKQLVHQFLRVVLGLILLILIGTTIFMKVEGWSVLDSLFMSVETLTTVGYGIPHELTDAGKVAAIIYILFGVILFLYYAARFANFLIMVNIEDILKKKTMDKKISKMKKHYIVCGYGRTGQEIANQLASKKLSFLVTDKDPEKITEAEEDGYIALLGDATDDDTLEKTGIEDAIGIFCALSDDVDNLYLTVSARNFSPTIKIVTRCVRASNEQKFIKAGATTTILPYEISARRMVTSITQPLITDFIDVVLHTEEKDLQLRLENFAINKDYSIVDKSIISSRLRDKTGITVVAIKRQGEFISNPDPQTIFEEGDNLIVMGSNDQLQKFGTFIKIGE